MASQGRGISPPTLYRYPNGEEVLFEGAPPHIPTPMDDLSHQEKVFVEYFVDLGDAREAARRAKYSRDVQLCASVLLNMPHIRKAVKVMRAARRESTRELTEIGASLGMQSLISIMMNPDSSIEHKMRCASLLASRSAVSPGRDMQDDLTDDAALEKLSGDKTRLALVEYEAARETEVEEAPPPKGAG